MVDIADDVLGSVFGELFKLVQHVAQTIAAFSGKLKKIQSTLSSIKPIIEDIEKYNKQLDRGPEEMAPIKVLLKEGTELLNRCSKIGKFNLCSRYTHSKKLNGFNKAVIEQFQVYMTLLNTATSKGTSVNVKEIGEVVKDVKELVKELSNGGFLQSGLEALGNLAVPAALDFIVGSDVNVTFSKVKERLLMEGSSVIVVTGLGVCGKTTLRKKLCHDVEIKGKFVDKIMFISASKKPNLTNIVKKMYQQNCEKIPAIKSEDAAVHCLQQLLKKIGKNPVLLVLDDVWKELESIDKFVCNDIKDYKIVVTMRYEFPQFRPVHHLNPLDLPRKAGSY